MERDWNFSQMIQFEGITEHIGKEYEAIGIVALSGIKYSGDGSDITKIFSYETIFCASCRQKYSFRGKIVDQFCIVVSIVHASIASCNDGKMLDHSAMEIVGHSL